MNMRLSSSEILSKPAKGHKVHEQVETQPANLSFSWALRFIQCLGNQVLFRFMKEQIWAPRFKAWDTSWSLSLRLSSTRFELGYSKPGVSGPWAWDSAAEDWSSWAALR
jgi:hypothetical protein